MAKCISGHNQQLSFKYYIADSKVIVKSITDPDDNCWKNFFSINWLTTFYVFVLTRMKKDRLRQEQLARERLEALRRKRAEGRKGPEDADDVVLREGDSTDLQVGCLYLFFAIPNHTNWHHIQYSSNEAFLYCNTRVWFSFWDLQSDQVVAKLIIT